MGEMRVMDRKGDVRVMWDPARPDEVAAAKKSFDEAKRKGMLAYKVKTKGGKGEVIRDFDATAGKIILAPPMQGG